ncbi:MULTISPECIES: hypothetical protein [unclassified Flavobacterium]|uniref:hypothetical protein n=1 Tax=unclassified Flavobacterium TaxID=196869 RepID=UPI001F144EE4|nr:MULTISPECIES: hypothetical protein [unclassified Flavobacterium]UMY66311.1 hypothetical protein MKO97_02720 [Flavobacterium sp. HJ-32-4]
MPNPSGRDVNYTYISSEKRSQPGWKRQPFEGATVLLPATAATAGSSTAPLQ